MSSSSKYGYASRICAVECPAASKPTTVPTVTRKPRMQGFPPMTAGSRVIRVKDFIILTTPVQQLGIGRDNYGRNQSVRAEAIYCLFSLSTSFLSTCEQPRQMETRLSTGPHDLSLIDKKGIIFLLGPEGDYTLDKRSSFLSFQQLNRFALYLDAIEFVVCQKIAFFYAIMKRAFAVQENSQGLFR